MKIKHVICDWDETLADTTQALKASFDFVLDSFNQPPKTLKEIKDITSSVAKSGVFQTMLGEKYAPLKSEAEAMYYAHFEANSLKNISLMPYAVDFLNYCKEKNLKLYVLSSKNQKYLEAEAKHLGIYEYFTAFYGSPMEDPKAQKPNRKAFENLFNGNPPLPEECVGVGDGPADIKLAENIGCKIILINPALGGVKNLKEAIKELEIITKV